MLPWHRKSIFVIVGTLRLSIFFLSIADGGRFVEGHFLMGGSFDLPQQFCLGPAVLGCGPKIPGSFLQRKARLQNDHVLGPADVHCQFQQFWGARIRPVEVPHPAQIARGESRNIWTLGGQILRNRDSGSFFGPLADQPPDLAVQLHLGQIFRQGGVYGTKKFAVVDIFPNVHGNSFPARSAYFLKQGKGLERLSCRPIPLP
jgi:hypothetical protein